jgi:hypothetical protein
MADLDDILPPGSYKLDLVDRVGSPVGLSVDVEIGALRNASAVESMDLEDGPVALSSGTSDVRFVLEANVRSTQLCAAIAEHLKPDELERLGRISPGFVAALQANDFDVMLLVRDFLPRSPEVIASWLQMHLDSVETRFAS